MRISQRLASTAILFSLMIGASACGQQTPALVEANARWNRLFNAHDAKGLSTEYTEDAVSVFTEGVRRQGRSEIEKLYRSSFELNPNVQNRNTEITHRDVAAGVVVEEGGWEQTGLSPNAKYSSGRYMVVYLKKDGKWLVNYKVSWPDTKTPVKGNIAIEPQPLNSVQGTIRMDGKPLVGASVVFSPESGRPSGALTDALGQYELKYSAGRKGATLGEHTVRISSASDERRDNEGQIVPGRVESVPARYNTQTELTVTIVSGANTIDFELSSE